MPKIDITATGNNITRMRKNAGLTVRDLQNIFGFGTPQAIYKWQNGTALPTVDNLVVLAVVFGCKIDDILVVDVPSWAKAADCNSVTKETSQVQILLHLFACVCEW